MSQFELPSAIFSDQKQKDAFDELLAKKTQELEEFYFSHARKNHISCWDEYEKQEKTFGQNLSRAFDLEKKLGASFFRVYRWGDAGMIKCVALFNTALAVGEGFVIENRGNTKPDADLIAAVDAYHNMQRLRRLWFLESQFTNPK
jgi:hypothetical protein